MNNTVTIEVSGVVVNLDATAPATSIYLSSSDLRAAPETCSQSRVWVTLDGTDNPPTYRFQCDAMYLGANAVLLRLSDPFLVSNGRRSRLSSDVETGALTVTLITGTETQQVVVQGVNFVDESEAS